MLDTIISLIAPHTCVACQKTGSLLCESCVNELSEERDEICIGCGNPHKDNLCESCKPVWQVERAVVLGERTEVLKTLIDEYKFNHRRAASRDLARLISPLLPYAADAMLIPIPTIPGHIRERGFDHMALLARTVARRNSLRYAPFLERRGVTVQYGASKRERLRQMQDAFITNAALDPQELYIVFDDVTTTGASLRAAVRVLQAAGAHRIWVAALARQPLDEPLDDRG